MEILGYLLIAVGGLASIVGGLWFLMVAFGEGLGWGVGCIIIPFVSLIFLVMHWEQAKSPFFVQLAGVIPLFLGLQLLGG